MGHKKAVEPILLVNGAMNFLLSVVHFVCLLVLVTFFKGGRIYHLISESQNFLTQKRRVEIAQFRYAFTDICVHHLHFMLSWILYRIVN